MLTRIEIDGFKTFEKFSLDVDPFVVILGPNSSGKSNLVDAVRLASRLAGMDLRSAVKGPRGEPHELFRRASDGNAGRRMEFAVEVLLNPEVRDPWGATTRISHSRVRYSVVIERRQDERGIEKLVVVEERADPILARNDRWRPWGRVVSSIFRHTFLKYVRRTPWLSTDRSSDRSSFHIHQDGSAGRTRSAEAAESTVLSSITSAEFPHLYALREELRSWRFLQLDLGALRRPSSTTAEDVLLESDGSNLATVLARLEAETRSANQPKGVLADIAADLASLIPGIVDLTVVEDKASHEYRIDIAVREGMSFSARVVSDGTIRTLALLTLLHDPRLRGLVCFEEPENGVHPARLKDMIRRLRALVVDPTDANMESETALSQMLLISHSPVVLSALGGQGVKFADLVTVVDPASQSRNSRTRIRPVTDQGYILPNGHDRQIVTSFEVDAYLSTARQDG